jgi:hypothetical protein
MKDKKKRARMRFISTFFGDSPKGLGITHGEGGGEKGQKTGMRLKSK